jgi:hypothetical protein
MLARARDKIVPRASPTRGSEKVIVKIFITVNRLLKLAYLPQGQKYNKEYFLNEKLKRINQECNYGTGYRVTKVMTIDMDNCRGHNASKHYRQFAE